MAAKLSKAGKITLRVYVLVPVVIAYHATACATAVYYAVNALEISVLIILFLIILGSEFCGNTALLDGSSTDLSISRLLKIRKKNRIYFRFFGKVAQ